MTQKPIVVIGGGIVGICTALACAQAGQAVTLIERDAPGQGASFGNAGVISPFSIIPQSAPGLWKNIPRWLLDPLGPVRVRPGYFPRFIPWGMRFLAKGRASEVARISAAMHHLNHDNIELFQQHLAGTGHEGLIQSSAYVYAFRDAKKASLEGQDMDLRRAVGAKISLLNAGELLELEPDLSPEFKAALVFHGQARAVSPGRIGAVLAEKLRAMGGVILRETAARIVPGTSARWAVVTDQTTHESDSVVISAGAWSAQILAPLGIKLPLEAERGYHVMFADPGVTLHNSIMDMDMKFVASSMEDGFRAAGTAEFAGLDQPPTQKRIEGLKTMARRMCPTMDDTRVSTWMGTRPSFPDSLPVIGPAPGKPGLTLAFGHAHWGSMMGPKTGRIAADLAMGRRPNVDLTPYRADRF